MEEILNAFNILEGEVTEMREKKLLKPVPLGWIKNFRNKIYYSRWFIQKKYIDCQQNMRHSGVPSPNLAFCSTSSVDVRLSKNFPEQKIYASLESLNEWSHGFQWRFQWPSNRCYWWSQSNDFGWTLKEPTLGPKVISKAGSVPSPKIPLTDRRSVRLLCQRSGTATLDATGSVNLVWGIPKLCVDESDTNNSNSPNWVVEACGFQMRSL